ncbi:MAG: radical SAM protein [Candidatus Heimdallarchaeota archaeon]
MNYNIHKLDKYLYEQKLDNEYWLNFNLLNFSFLITDKPFSQTKLNELDDDVLDTLREYKFLLNENEENLFEQIKNERILEIQNNYKSNTGKVELTIMPTLECNFRCIYCYQPLANEKETRIEKQFITKGIMNSLFTFLEQRDYFNSRGIRLIVCGGEVFLDNKNTSDFINDLVTKTKTYSIDEIHFTTNGYFLDQYIANLKQINVSNVFYNITIDGPAKIHNKRRYLANGQGTFHVIISNIKRILKETNHKIIIRVNLDDDNIDYIDEFILYLKRQNLLDEERSFIQFKNVNIYKTDVKQDNPIPIHSTKNRKHILYTVLDITQKYKINILLAEFIPRIIQEIFISEISGKNIESYKPIRIGCIHNQGSFGAIDFNGDLLPCLYDFSPKIGNIMDIGSLDKNKLKYWDSKECIIDKYTSEPCIKCKYFFLCSGRQCHYANFYSYNKDMGFCVEFQNDLQNFFEYYNSKRNK